MAMFCLAGSALQTPRCRYFLPAGAGTKGTTLRSLRHALGPQAGTLCFAAAVTTAARIARALAEGLRRRGGALGWLLSWPLRWAAELTELLTKYATSKYIQPMYGWLFYFLLGHEQQLQSATRHRAAHSLLTQARSCPSERSHGERNRRGAGWIGPACGRPPETQPTRGLGE